MEKQNSGLKETASKEQWVLEGNKTVIPKGAKPYSMPINIANRRNKKPSPDGVPHPDLDDVLDAKEFVDNHQMT